MMMVVVVVFVCFQKIKKIMYKFKTGEMNELPHQAVQHGIKEAMRLDRAVSSLLWRGRAWGSE